MLTNIRLRRRRRERGRQPVLAGLPALVWLAPTKWRTLKSGDRCRTYVAAGGEWKIEETRPPGRRGPRRFTAYLLRIVDGQPIWDYADGKSHPTLASAQRVCRHKPGGTR